MFFCSGQRVSHPLTQYSQVPQAYASHGTATLRFSLGHDTTVDDVDYVLEIRPAIIERSRSKRLAPAR